MSYKSLVEEIEQVQLAIELIELGARLQVLQAETDLSRSRLIKLYKEIRGASPPKGMLPSSAEWFTTWRSNIHSSLFYNLYRRLSEEQGCQRIEAFVKAYRMYVQQAEIDTEGEVVLDMTRAWTLVRFFESGMFELAECTDCSGHFLVHAYTPVKDFICGICQPPSRAGKTRRSAGEND